MGSCNRFGRMTGDDVVYLYPDLHTALVGSWNNDVMRAGRLSVVTGITMEVSGPSDCNNSRKRY